MRADRYPIVAGLLLCASLGRAAPLPMRVDFQGKLLDKSTNEPKNGVLTMTFALYNVPSGGTALYTEGPKTVQVNNGVFEVEIGTDTALSAELFSGASAYLGVTVSPDAEMTPRTPFVMSPYAFTAMQLVSPASIRVNAGLAYSTFTAGGDLQVPYGVSAGTGTFTGSVTASSGTFTASGASQYSLQTASGIVVNAGTLRVLGPMDSDGLGTFRASGGSQYSLATTSGIAVNAGTLRVLGSVDSDGLGTFRAGGNSQYSLVTSSGIRVTGGTLRVESPGGIDAGVTGINASTAAFTATGNTYSLVTSSGIQMQAGYMGVGLNYVAFTGGRAGCGTSFIAIGGGCSSLTKNVARSFPSVESDSNAAAGSAVSNGATSARSWSCVYSGTDASAIAYAVCARIGP